MKRRVCAVCRAMEGPRAGIGNVEQHVNQLEQRLEDCLIQKANCADVPTLTQVSHARWCRIPSISLLVRLSGLLPVGQSVCVCV